MEVELFLDVLLTIKDFDFAKNIKLEEQRVSDGNNKELTEAYTGPGKLLILIFK